MKKTVISYSVGIVLLMTISLININIVFGEQGGGGSDPQCSSGGPGSTSCYISVIVNGKLKECSKTCNSNKYACCYIKNGTKPKCKCKRYNSNN